MTVYDSPTLTALQAGGMILRDLLYVRGLDGSNNPVTFGFWPGVDNVTLSVIKAVDPTSTESRSYIGGGSLLPDGVDPIIYQLGLDAQTINVKLSNIHASVLSMLHGYNIRLAEAELHRALFDLSTGLVVSTPYPRFYGIIEGAPLTDAAVGSEGYITLSITGISIDLTRTNPAMESDAQQQLRSSDRFRRYGDTAGDWTVWWGEAKSSTTTSSGRVN
jgi:hypothetical protein